MANSNKTIDGFAYWIENEENGVCYIPLNLCKEIMELLKEQEDFGKELTDAVELIHKKNARIKELEKQIETLTRWRADAGAFD